MDENIGIKTRVNERQHHSEDNFGRKKSCMKTTLQRRQHCNEDNIAMKTTIEAR